MYDCCAISPLLHCVFSLSIYIYIYICIIIHIFM